jgi:hypothetical protein
MFSVKSVGDQVAAVGLAVSVQLLCSANLSALAADSSSAAAKVPAPGPTLKNAPPAMPSK